MVKEVFMFMNIDVKNLNTMTFDSYKRLLRECKKLTSKACRRYKIYQLINNPEEANEVTHDICVRALLKAIKNYSKKRGSFSTYFYYKASSLARVEAGKLKRRYSLINTTELNTEKLC